MKAVIITLFVVGQNACLLCFPGPHVITCLIYYLLFILSTFMATSSRCITAYGYSTDVTLSPTAPQNELRRRRLTREGGERERQIRLLAEREMAGQSLPDERSIAYNNQYNAPAARQNR